MKNLALHLLDLLENSAKAGAGCVRVALGVTDEGRLVGMIEDDGPGFPDTLPGPPDDPFVTTRTERPVGLGLSLFRQAAEATGGNCAVSNRPEGGARVAFEFELSSMDMKPFGDVALLLLDATAAWPELDMVVVVGTDSPETVLDTRDIRRELGNIPLDLPSIRSFMRTALREGLAPLQAQADAFSPFGA